MAFCYFELSWVEKFKERFYPRFPVKHGIYVGRIWKKNILKRKEVGGDPRWKLSSTRLCMPPALNIHFHLRITFLMKNSTHLESHKIIIKATPRRIQTWIVRGRKPHWIKEYDAREANWYNTVLTGLIVHTTQNGYAKNERQQNKWA